MTEKDWIIYQTTIKRIKELAVRNEPLAYCDLEWRAFKYIDRDGRVRVDIDFDILSEIYDTLYIVDLCRDALIHNPHMQDKRNFTPATRAVMDILTRDATPREKGIVTFPRKAWEDVKLLQLLTPLWDNRKARKKNP